MTASNINNGQIYELLNQTRLESKGDISRIESKVDILQAQVNKQQITISITSFKLAIIGFISSSVVGALVSVIAINWLGKK